MSILQGTFGLYTDFYELTMAQGYFSSGKKDEQATFDYYFRTNPYRGGFTVFAGLHDLLELLADFTFSVSDLDFLRKQGFDQDFLDYLGNFRFGGDIFSVHEGELVFPNEPIVQVNGTIIECQLIESFLLNLLNFESLIATKAFRVKLAADGRPFTDFGMRRAQGLGAHHATRAACIGGAASTSNSLAGKIFDVPLSGTQAHSWIQGFDDELEAFRVYARVHPKNTILLVDTYDTLRSGIPNAIKVAKEMEQNGHRLQGIRLDSGDLAYLSKKARKMLDEAGLEYVKIVASNQLNEFVINSLLKDQNAAIDIFGIGTELVTGKPDASLDGVYKLAEIDGHPRMKLSENIVKTTLPGKKQVVRYFDDAGYFFRDAILLDSEDATQVETIYHPVYADKKTSVKNLHSEPLLHQVVAQGENRLATKSVVDIHNYLLTRSAQLANEHKRFISPHIYKVGISKKLMNMRNALAKSLKDKF